MTNTINVINEYLDCRISQPPLIIAYLNSNNTNDSTEVEHAAFSKDKEKCVSISSS